MYARIAIMSPPWAALDYLLPEAFPADFWRTGGRVIVPVGGSLRAGVILSISAMTSLDASRCKSVLWPLELRPLISRELLELVVNLATYQGTTPGNVLGHILPLGLRRAQVKLRRNEDAERRFLTAPQIARLSPGDYAELADKFLRGMVKFVVGEGNAATREIVSLAMDPPWPVRPAARIQRAILELLHEKGAMPRSRLLQEMGSGIGAPLKRLQAMGVVSLKVAVDLEDDLPLLLPPPDPNFRLNEAQVTALADLKAAVNRGETCRLLYGVTGSGKTAVYLEFVRWLLTQGRSAMLLAPEVALAHKLFRDVELALPHVPRFLYHGYQSPAQREQIYRKLASATGPVVVVGTRSAIFLPMPNIGCIIMDEEHDGSYKQTDNFVYHARDMAWFRTRQCGGLLILGSATPDLRTFYASESGVIPRLTLRTRVGGAEPPPIKLVQMGTRAGKDGISILAESSEQALDDCLRRGEQAVILLNRRGYAPLVWCVSCNEVIRCPHCQIGMAYHKQTGRLSCHFCGHAIPWPGPCPKCGDTSFVAMGEGTERLAERLETIAGRPILRLDRDNARRPGKIEEILSAFGRGESPFLVGTQMLSKGHHFPNVTLAIVADGDIGLNLPDYRAAERSFQLLVQAAGRAGRGSKPGLAIIQTRNPEHYCWQSMVRYDYEGFYAAELERRRRLRYPPFVRLGLLRLSFPVNDEEAAAVCRQIGKELKIRARAVNIHFYGPVSAPLAILQGRRRMQCLMKGQEWETMRQLWFLAQKHNTARQLRISLDLDPVDMM